MRTTQKIFPEVKSEETAITKSDSKPYRVVKITVSGNEYNTINNSNNVVFPAIDTTVTIDSLDGEKEALSIKLHEINHTTEKFFDFVTNEYSVEIFFSKSKVTTKLSPEMSLNLINFFKLYKPKSKSNYCCINFAYEMVYGRGKITNDNDTGNFDEEPSSAFSEEKLTPGDIVHLFNTRQILHHYAIFIGQNNYLSLFGSAGPLIVTTLDAVKKGFETNTCVRATKSSKPYFITNMNRFFKPALAAAGWAVIGLATYDGGAGLAAAAVGFEFQRFLKKQ